MWVTQERLNFVRKQSVAAYALWAKATLKGRECRQRATVRANKKHREAHLAYYRRPDVRQRIRTRHNSKPEVVALREARLSWRAERAAYRASDEYKTVLKDRNKRTYLNRKASGKMAKFYRDKRRTDAVYRLTANMRRLITYALTQNLGALRAARTFDLIGCSVSALRLHLESQFTEPMTWENYGSIWHVDHRIPMSLFNLTDARQQRIAFHFENLRPLLAVENQQKSDFIEVDGKKVRAREIRNNIISFKAA